MSAFKPRAPKPRPIRVPRLVHDDLVKRGKRQGFDEVRALPFWRRVRVALRIVGGLTAAEREVRRVQRSIEAYEARETQRTEDPAYR